MTGPIGHLQSPFTCRHLDLRLAIAVFGGLCLAALIAPMALSSTVDAVGATTSEIEEVRVIGDEYAAGPDAIDPLALTCEQQGQQDNSQENCRESQKQSQRAAQN